MNERVNVFYTINVLCVFFIRHSPVEICVEWCPVMYIMYICVEVRLLTNYNTDIYLIGICTLYFLNKHFV
jgi:hypothetical protein